MVAKTIASTRPQTLANQLHSLSRFGKILPKMQQNPNKL